jgi:hypothetical protein
MSQTSEASSGRRISRAFARGGWLPRAPGEAHLLVAGGGARGSPGNCRNEGSIGTVPLPLPQLLARGERCVVCREPRPPRRRRAARRNLDLCVGDAPALHLQAPRLALWSPARSSTPSSSRRRRGRCRGGGGGGHWRRRVGVWSALLACYWSSRSPRRWCGRRAGL